MSNKGKVLRFCKECNHKRFVTKVSIPGHNYRFTCIKGHQWIIKGITLERIMSVYNEIFNSEKLKSLFEQDDTFYKALK